MKKIYSLVLMAVILLLGTNMWATVRTAGNANELKDAWENAESGDEIKLTASFSIGTTLWLGTQTMDDEPLSITLNLNGDTLSSTAEKVFVLSHGSLNVTGNGGIKHDIAEATAYDSKNKEYKSKYEIFRVLGSTYKGAAYDAKTSDTHYTHLTIGAGVKLVAAVNGITVDQCSSAPFTTAWAAGKKSVPTWTNMTNVYGTAANKTKGDRGVANGVRIDVLGTIHATKYAIKANGNLGSTSNYPLTSYTGTYKYYQAPNVAYEVEAGDDQYSPYIVIGKTAELLTLKPERRDAVAAYSGGYARWYVEGSCVGSTGVYVKSGEIVLNDAVVASNYSGNDYSPAVDTKSGVQCGGSGIVMQSSTVYAGDISVSVQGDTKVTGTSGYAIDEAVTATDENTKVDVITIAGGTFESGNEGTMRVTETTAIAAADPTQETVITIIGGNADNTSSTIGTQTLENYLAGQSDVHVTVVDNGQGGTTLVISEGAAPAVANSVIGATPNTSINWQNAVTKEETLTGDLSLKDLEINQAYAQKLTIPTGKTLTVERVILGANAQIVVEAGGKFIVTGNQGIVAPVTSNIVLNTSATDPATFLFDPSVQSNRHPNATVKLLAKQIGYETYNATKYWYWNRFALPINQATTWSKTPNVTSYIYKWSYENDDWMTISALTDMVPFQGYILTANQDVLGDVEYTFTGELAGGNETAALQFARNGFHFFGNSYTGYVSVDKMVEQIMGASDIDGTVWVWDDDQQYHAVPLMALRNNPAAFPDAYKEIAPMQTFVLKHNVNATGATELNYATAVWGNPRYNSFNGNAAPRRHAADQATHMNIVVTAENGKSDNVMFMEDGSCSDEYDNGYDGAKYMNEDALNMYASVNGADYSVVATDNIEGKMLTINTVNDVHYTMTFANVNSDEYAIRDNVTGSVIAIEEGATYEFAAQPNSVAEGRFEIVKVSKVATDIENTEVKANAKGIYTIMGQYVGENFDVLPAGIYVINGVKIAK